MSNDPTKIYDDKMYVFPESETSKKQQEERFGDRFAPRWDNRWKSRWGNQFTEKQEEEEKPTYTPPVEPMNYEEFKAKYKYNIENAQKGKWKNKHQAILETVKQAYSLWSNADYTGWKLSDDLFRIKRKATELEYGNDVHRVNHYVKVCEGFGNEMIKRLNNFKSDWYEQAIVPFQKEKAEQEQALKKSQKEVAQLRKDIRIEDAQKALTHDNYANQSSQDISENAQILSYEAFVSKYKDAIEGRAKSLEKKNQYSGATAELVATMQIAQLVYGVQLHEIKNKDGKVESYHYRTQISQGIQKKAQSNFNYKKASQDMRNAGEVMQFYWNTGICMDERYDDILINSKWLEKAQAYRNLRETKMDTLRANQREERTNTMREKYEHDILEIAKNKELKKKLSELRKSKMREAMVDLGFCLLGVGITLASGGVGALIGQPLVLLLEADEIIGASRVLLTSNDELDPEKEYKIIKGQFVEWGGKAGDDAYERIAFFLDGKSILSSYLQRNPDKSTISGMSLINLLEEAQDRKDKFDFVVDIKDKVAGEEEKKDK
jgi:hypothetical protein